MQPEAIFLLFSLQNVEIALLNVISVLELLVYLILFIHVCSIIQFQQEFSPPWVVSGALHFSLPAHVTLIVLNALIAYCRWNSVGKRRQSGREDRISHGT